jgi:UDP-glucuronate 4-epimerase
VQDSTGGKVLHALVTGGAGFIGSHLVGRLLRDGWQVTALDNFDPFYSPAIKQENIAQFARDRRFELLTVDIRDFAGLRSALTKHYDVVFHLAAKAGVRPSIEDPISYQEVNVCGTQNLLELARSRKWPRFVFASSSSVYGVNPRVPWREDDAELMPISPYASTKLSGEFLGHVYSHLFGVNFIALRFFTVYGPRQRPDLAIHKFGRSLLSGEVIPIFGDGSSSRDYTYVDDIVEGILAAARYQGSRFEVVNLGNNHGVRLRDMVEQLGAVLKTKPRVVFLPDQPGDVPQTRADISKAQKLFEYNPQTSFHDGLEHFASWLKQQEFSTEPVHARGRHARALSI